MKDLQSNSYVWCQSSPLPIFITRIRNIKNHKFGGHHLIFKVLTTIHYSIDKESNTSQMQMVLVFVTVCSPHS